VTAQAAGCDGTRTTVSRNLALQLVLWKMATELILVKFEMGEMRACDNVSLNALYTPG
jgi:hypothetical protein